MPPVKFLYSTPAMARRLAARILICAAKAEEINKSTPVDTVGAPTFD